MARVELAIDLGHERFEALPTSTVGQIERLFGERSVVEQADLLALSAGVLNAFAERGFRLVDHWEFVPGGWLALPEPAHRTLGEPAEHLLRALRNPGWRPYANAREFAVRLSGPAHLRADLRVRRVHRERAHSLSIVLYGIVGSGEIRSLTRALERHVPVLRAQVLAYVVRSDPPGVAPNRRSRGRVRPG